MKTIVEITIVDKHLATDGTICSVEIALEVKIYFNTHYIIPDEFL